MELTLYCINYLLNEDYTRKCPNTKSDFIEMFNRHSVFLVTQGSNEVEIDAEHYDPDICLDTFVWEDEDE